MSLAADTVTERYIQRVADLEIHYRKISRQCSRLSWGRLAAALPAIAAFYGYFHSRTPYLLVPGLFFSILFIVLIKRHQHAVYKKQFALAMLLINKEELAYFEEGALPFDNGMVFKDPQHAYTDDLDFFGNRSLYQHLNRTATQMGKETLARAFVKQVSFEEIKARQEAVAELAADRDKRQELYASGRIVQDSKAIYDQLLTWSGEPVRPLHPLTLLLAWLLPLALLSCLLLYGFTRENFYKDMALRLFPVNLLVFSFQVKRIRRSLFSSEKTHALLQAYSAILLRIENTTYTSPLLKALQQKLYAGNQKAGTLLQKLAAIYSGMETVQNPFAAVITNGLYLNHIHLLSRLIRWRRQYAAQIPEWLEVIGAFEMLGSLANFHDNHPGFCFPRLNKEEMIRFKEMGHPLLSAAKRINNDACFDSYRFMILTGSNMSGKSTFLRTLGVNMILSGMGSVVCAVDADVHPMPVFVSMRQSDSLADSESYFFAEVKRLKYIMDQMDEGAVFVLLDEILRGTNSDDKRSGTVGVIEKISGKKVYGAIATHDLEVCLTTDKYPGILSNKCFEVEIRNDELVFDYKLREGICRNKSATFLMKKMKII